MAKMKPRMQQSDDRADGLREKMVSVNRVTKVVKGGRVLGFAALTVVGDGDGGIGMGKGKAREVPGRGAEGDGRGAPQALQGEAEERHAAPRRHRPARRGDGAHAAGLRGHRHHRRRSHARGVRGHGRDQHAAKCFGSTNPYNVVRATLKGLQSMNTPAEIAAKRGKKVEELFS
jgi:small subunit ribosomal protein S5